MSLATKDRKEVSGLVRAVLLVKSAGYLKEPVQCAGEILHANHEHFFSWAQHGDLSMLSQVLAIAGRHDRTLQAYVETFFPATYVGDRFKFQRCSNDELLRMKGAVISFDSFKRLRDIKIEVTLEQLESIRDELSPISVDWRVALDTFARWPTTDAPPSLAQLVEDGWLKAGFLSHSGYHVGMNGLPRQKRIALLEGLLTKEVDTKIFNQSYADEWGESGSLNRLMKTARTIAALCRNAKRSPSNMTQAISDWEADLDYLRKNHYETFLNLRGEEWPRT